MPSKRVDTSGPLPSIPADDERSVGMVKSGVEATAQADRTCLSNVVASKEMHKSALPELLRMQEIMER